MSVQILSGDCRDVLKTLPDQSVNCIVTSPPYYGLRDYGIAEQIGLEDTPDAYVAEMVVVFREARRVLRDDGTLWLNIGDSYAGSGRGAWNISDEEKSARGVKETYRPNVRAGGSGVRPGSARADGKVVEGKTIRNRDGLGPVQGLKPKDLIGIPWRVAFALQADGWYLRQDIIWHKPNPMPESVRDRCTKAHEYVFMLTKSARYLYDAEAISEEAIYAGLTGQDDSGFKDPETFSGKHSKKDKQRGHSRRHAGFNERWDQMTKAEQQTGRRNKRSVWTIATRPFSEAHFATMAPELARLCIMAGCPLGGTVLDMFGGAGTTALVADQLQRSAIIIELNPEYVGIAQKRINADAGLFGEVTA